MRLGVYGLCGVLLILQRSLIAQTTSPASDAAVMYEAADAVVARSVAAKIWCPSNSAIDTSYPYSIEYRIMEKADFAANEPARVLAHQARAIDHANWPPLIEPYPDFTSLNHLRELSNDLADAAIYEHLQGDDASAVETIKDLLHLSDLLQDSPDKKLSRFLVSVGIQLMSMDRLNVITSGVVLSNDPADIKRLQTRAAGDLIQILLKQKGARTQVDDWVNAEGGIAVVTTRKINIDRFIITGNRANSERDMAAMSLACHLYRFTNGNWPKSADDLKDYFSKIPVDPFGDGNQTLGYALVKAGLPDGSDRPLVYSRCNSQNGLFIRNDRPFYSSYIGDGSTLPRDQQKQGGQFRDVASWVPDKNKPPASLTQPLDQ